MNPSEQQTQTPATQTATSAPALPKPPAWFSQRYNPAATPSEFRFECPHCGQHFVADVGMAGRKLECPGCVKKFVIPNP
jgi:DNA-directed RNA polymerase subunit RPC12/RpoP